MSMETDLIATVSSLAYPCAVNIYTGTATTYFVFNYTVIPADYADDEPQHDRYLVQLHFYAPHTVNTVTVRKSIRSLIQAAFMRPTEMPAHDELNQHYVYEFEAEDGTS